jgi:putative methionine-R-sulfoxide reductase with GAF domain
METAGSNPVGAGRELPPSLRTRRRRVRQKVHTPAYASLNGSASGQVLDLSEIVDISEEGMAIQTSFPLQVQRHVNLFLDLTATKTCIRTKGEVIWCDGSGRVGISFPQMPADALRQLKEWLFVNAMVACVNYRADLVAGEQVSGDRFSGKELSGDQQFAKRWPATQSPVPPLSVTRLSVPQLSQAAAKSVLEKPAEQSALVNWMRQELEPTAPADYTSVLTALAAVKREVDSLGSDLDQALRLLALRALTFTRATGAAIALTEGSSMVCRASAGEDAPGVGARLTVGSGFSGECVRTGQLLRCEDTETDPLVDRESCRRLGIRSMVAVPVRWGEPVIGLLEVFSPQPYAFSTNDPIVLKRLAGIISTAVYRAGVPERVSGHAVLETGSAKLASAKAVSPKSGPAPLVVTSVDDEFPVETAADLPVPHFSRAQKILLAAALATVVFAGTWLISPRDFTKIAGAASPSPASVKIPPKVVAASAPVGGGLESIRKLAEQGDAAAQFSVGARYATGEDVPQDYAEAVRWFAMAAEQGHVVAQATLGAYYWAGRGVPQDLVKAYFWSVLAKAGGDEASKYRVSVLASRMNRAQIEAAQQLANDWIKEHQAITQNAAAPR